MPYPLPYTPRPDPRASLSAPEIRSLTLFKWRYSLESAGFTPDEARRLLFLQWRTARTPQLAHEVLAARRSAF